MSRKAFEASLQSGPHADLARMVGDWKGKLRVWFEPGQLGGEGTVRGSFRSLLGGRFVMHEYEGDCAGEAEQGLAIHGYHLDRHRHESAWIDSFHTGTQLMYSVGVPMAALHSVLGSYGGETDGEPWGWRTQLEMPGNDQLLIRMYNVTPTGLEALAVEFDYRRVHAVRSL